MLTQYINSYVRLNKQKFSECTDPKEIFNRFSVFWHFLSENNANVYEKLLRRELGCMENMKKCYECLTVFHAIYPHFPFSYANWKTTSLTTQNVSKDLKLSRIPVNTQ
jgi:hypothetical protein